MMFKITFSGKVAGEVELEQELNLLGAATKGDLALPHRCGGHARCGTCLLTVESGREQLSPVGAAEARILKVLKAGETQRLGCQAWARGDVACRVG
jgi:ferredoxin, 2Fe-2S